MRRNILDEISDILANPEAFAKAHAERVQAHNRRVENTNEALIRNALGKKFTVTSNGLRYTGTITEARLEGSVAIIRLQCGDYVHGPFRVRKLPK